MKTALVVAALATLLAPCAHANPQLAGKYACTACHQADRKAVGPAWKEIAAKYGEGQAAKLAASIRGGSSGKWGTVPMPAQPAVAEADALALANWVLQQK